MGKEDTMQLICCHSNAVMSCCVSREHDTWHFQSSHFEPVIAAVVTGNVMF